MTIGEKIKNLRLQYKYTQEELAVAAKTTKQTIHKYETGIISNIPASKLKSIADKLNTTPAHLMGWDTTETLPEIIYTPHEQKVIKEYRSKPEMQPAVDKLLGIEPEDNVTTLEKYNDQPFIAASSGKEYHVKAPDEKTKIKLKKDKYK